MKTVRKFLVGLLLYLPFGKAFAIVPIVVGLLVVVGTSMGFSVYRSLAPVNMDQALNFFSSCWSCDLFNVIIKNLSNFIPKIYDAIAGNMMPLAVGLSIVYFTWLVLSDYIKVKSETNPWQLGSIFGTHIIKLGVVVALFLFPLPTFITHFFVEPIVGTGLAITNISRGYILPNDNSLGECMVATVLDEKSDVESGGAFSPWLRHDLACNIADFHKVTGIGMATGWTFMNMAFSAKYMWGHFFPNLTLIFAGLGLIVVFLWALMPVPLYFLEIFIGLSMDLIMLPFFLLGWLFSEWGIFPKGANGKGIMKIITDAVKNTCALALLGLFIGFSIMFLSSAVGDINGINGLVQAFQNNDSKFMMDSLSMNNGSLISLVMAGIFIGMFMNAIPNLIKTLFSNEALLQMKAEEMQNNIKNFSQNSAKAAFDIITGKKGKKSSDDSGEGSGKDSDKTS